MARVDPGPPQRPGLQEPRPHLANGDPLSLRPAELLSRTAVADRARYAVPLPVASSSHGRRPCRRRHELGGLEHMAGGDWNIGVDADGRKLSPHAEVAHDVTALRAPASDNGHALHADDDRLRVAVATRTRWRLEGAHLPGWINVVAPIGLSDYNSFGSVDAEGWPSGLRRLS